MKRKILSIIFVAAMSVGLAVADGIDHGKNQGTCITVQAKCGPSGGFIATICGTGENDSEVRSAQLEELAFWMRFYGC